MITTLQRGGTAKWLQYYIGGGMPKWLQYYIGGGVSRDPQKWLRNMCTPPYCLLKVVPMLCYWLLVRLINHYHLLLGEVLLLLVFFRVVLLVLRSGLTVSFINRLLSSAALKPTSFWLHGASPRLLFQPDKKVSYFYNSNAITYFK